MPKVIVMDGPGGPEVLRAEERELPPPGPGEVRLRHTAIGLNFVDTYYRKGLYPAPFSPFTPGNEAAGVVTRVGPGVVGFAEGDRVGYSTLNGGAYADERNADAAELIPLPAAIDDRTAASVLLKGMTAQYLLRQSFVVGPEHTILVHAAAGGVGQILCQWAKAIGATVIGTAGSPQKVELARAAGCDVVIDYRKENFVERVRKVTGGALCHAVYDGVGQDTYPDSLDCIRPKGILVSYGNASGPIRNFDLLKLAARGSLYVTRPRLGTFTATRPELLAVAGEVLGAVEEGVFSVPIGQEFRLEDAAGAHRALEARTTIGASLLIP